MNWYSIIKIAQIWNITPYDEFGNEFEINLHSLYELEYKWSMINQHPFNGLEQRRQNISEHLRSNLNEVADNVKHVLSGVFGKWLASHAILDPGTWAAERAKDEFDGLNIEERFGGLLQEYLKYDQGFGNRPPSSTESRNSEYKAVQEFLTFIAENTEKFPSLSWTFDEVLDIRRQSLYSDLSEEGLEEFSERYNKEFKSEEDAHAFIENLEIEDIDVDQLIYAEDIEQLSSFIEGGDVEEVLVELYKNFVFPVWYAHWKEQGIDKTRSTIETINSRLESSNPENTQEFMASVNIALNAAHQTGAMTDYIEQDTMAGNIEGVLEDLSAGTFVPEWDKQLREVGVQV